MKKAEKSIQKQLRDFMAGILLTSCLVIMLCILASTHLINENSRFLDSMGILSDFYKTAGEMDSAARTYISDKNELDYLKYQEAKKEAEEELSRLALLFPGETSIRISFLGNMLETYNESLNELKPGNNWYECYQELTYRNQLLQNTEGRYHELLVDSIRREMGVMERTWFLQIMGITGMFFLLLAGAAFFSVRYNKRITRPIQEMVKNIEQIQKGDYNIQPVSSGPAEIKILGDAFIQMAGAIQNNIRLLKYNMEMDKQLLERENENLNMKNLLYRTELKSLQAQINPHFLFNTLNMIAKKAALNGDNETTFLMENVSALLRYGLDKANKISTVKEELSCIEHYFFIQQKRFEGRVSFSLDIQENIPDIPMPAMTLQPLVENSVIHGIKDVQEDAEVILRVFRSENMLQIQVEDNGLGMESEELERLLVSLRVDAIHKEQVGNHIGLNNVYRRLVMYYGEELGFIIESESGCGTIVSLEIPLEAEE